MHRYVLIENHERAQEILNKTYTCIVGPPVYACLHLLAKLESHSQWQVHTCINVNIYGHP